jgi:hypothetical protein
MKPEDYAPGTVIDTPELLRAVLANEDAVYLHGAFVECSFFAKYVSAGWPRTDTGDGRFARACLKCPQTGKEMRAAIRAPVVDKTYGKHKP